MSEKVERARRWLDEAEALLLASGAGLSAAAGIDYSDSEWFAENFAPMLQYGITTCGEILGGMGLPPRLQWGYLSHQLELVRFGHVDYPVYRRQLESLKGRDYFVITSNVDGLYERHGFSPRRIYTPQGDYARLQCTTPCSEQTWPTRAYLDPIRAATDAETFELRNSSLLPTCPRCGAPLFMNVRAADWFLEAPYREQAKRFRRWLSELGDRNLLIVEIGAGFNTPMVIRWPMEQITALRPKTRLIRVNPNAAHGPEQIERQSLSFDDDAREFVRQCFAGEVKDPARQRAEAAGSAVRDTRASP